MTHSNVVRSSFKAALYSCAIAVCLTACSTPTKLSSAELDRMGVRESAPYWMVQQALAQQGYQCYVSGQKRENFDCSSTFSGLRTCVLRISFVANSENKVSALRVAEPACIGTP